MAVFPRHRAVPCPGTGPPASWRQLMSELPFEDWLHLMMGRAQRGFDFRLKWLKEHNSTCQLIDLAGKCVANQQPEDLEEGA